MIFSFEILSQINISFFFFQFGEPGSIAVTMQSSDSQETKSSQDEQLCNIQV